MLSKVACRIYWAARYLERLENTARLMDVYANLLLDLPKGVNLGWFNLVTLNSLEANFNAHYKNQDERNVVKYLLVDEFNSSSALSSLVAARENVRTTRDVIPARVWEYINELTIFLQSTGAKASNRELRRECIDGVVRRCQRISGILHSTMAHDDAWEFLSLGRYLERADMTTRLLDAGCVTALQIQADQAQAVNAKQIIWGNVLRSAGAEQSYRRHLRSPIQGREVVKYLLEDRRYPKALRFCLDNLKQSVAKLPGGDIQVKTVEVLDEQLFKSINYSDLGQSMRDYLNDVQLSLCDLNQSFTQQWFE